MEGVERNKICLEGVEGEQNLYGGRKRGTKSEWREQKKKRTYMKGVE